MYIILERMFCILNLFRYTSMLQIAPFINKMVFGSKFEDLVVRKTRDENFLWKLFKFKCVIQ